MCGSSDLNERMRTLALSDLRDQEYLVAAGTMEAIVDRFIMPLFENEHKRSFKYHDSFQRFVTRYVLLSDNVREVRVNAQTAPEEPQTCQHFLVLEDNPAADAWLATQGISVPGPAPYLVSGRP